LPHYEVFDLLQNFSPKNGKYSCQGLKSNELGINLSKPLWRINDGQGTNPASAKILFLQKTGLKNHNSQNFRRLLQKIAIKFAYG